MSKRVLPCVLAVVAAAVVLPLVAVPVVQMAGSAVAWGYLATGAGAGGGPHARAFNLADNTSGFDPGGDQLVSFFPYATAFRGGVRVAIGPFGFGSTSTYDSLLVSGAGPGGGPHVQVFDVSRQTPGTINQVASFFAFSAAFRGGVSVATGEFDGNSLTKEIVTGAGSGGGPHVKIFTVTQAGVVQEFASFFAYAPSFTGGVWVAAGDVDNDGIDDLITGAGAGAGGGPHVRVFKVDGSGNATSFASWFAYPAGFRGGAFVASADVDNDLRAEVITGAGAGGSPHVRVFDVANDGSATEQVGFLAYPTGFRGGVRVGAGDLDSTTAASRILTGAGPGGGPHVRSFNVSSGTVSAGTVSFFPFPAGFTGGVFVAGSERA